MTLHAVDLAAKSTVEQDQQVLGAGSELSLLGF